MPERRANQTSPGSIIGSGALLGALALLGGTTWLLKGNSQSGHQRMKLDKQNLPTVSDSRSSRNPWLLGALGAGLAGAALGASGYARRQNTSSHGGTDDIHLSGHVTIRRSPEEVYQYWKNFRNLPEVMSFVERVEPLEGNLSHWVARVPSGPTIEWDAETVDDQPGKRLAWRSIEGSDLQTWGTVIFDRQQKSNSTDLSVAFNFSPPANASGAAARYLSGLENAVLQQNLRNLKAHLESQAQTSPPVLQSTTGGA